MIALLPILSLFAVASAQSTTSASATDVAVEEAKFEGAQLVPQFLPTFSPEGILTMSFGGQQADTGAALDASAVGSSPELSIIPTENATRFGEMGMYTVIMADADIPGTDYAANPQTRHWLVNSASVQADGEGPYPLNFTGSTAITDYAGPGPAEGSGPHRYVVLVYSQPPQFTAPADLSAAGTPLGTFQVQEYVNSTGLGALVAANYFTVEVGQATVSVPATTSVDPATVSAASTSSGPALLSSGQSMMTTGSMTGSSSMTGGPSSSGASATTSPHAAGKVSVGAGALVGAIGVVGTIFGAALAL